MIFTVGHSNHSLETFVRLLREHAIDLVVDVRSEPYSAAVPHFNRPLLEVKLSSIDLGYRWEPDLGARPSDPSVYLEGRLSYRLLSAQPRFREALSRVSQLGLSKRLALTCSEREPLECPRFLLVGRLLREQGLSVHHILSSGAIEDHAQVELRLLAHTNQNRPDLFLSPADALAEAYRRQEEVVTRRRRAAAESSTDPID